MNWTFVIGPKIKVCVLMAIVMALIVISNLMSRKNINDVNKAIVSIYQDRLIPASDLLYINDLLYQKRFLIEQMLFKPKYSRQQSITELFHHNMAINNLIAKYEQTQMVDKEFEFLRQFKAQLLNYDQLEKAVITLIQSGELTAAQRMQDVAVRTAHRKTIATLIELNKIQTLVGSEIIRDSKLILNISTFFSTLQILLAIAIGAAIIKLVAVSKLISRPQDNFNLN